MFVFFLIFVCLHVFSLKMDVFVMVFLVVCLVVMEHCVGCGCTARLSLSGAFIWYGLLSCTFLKSVFEGWEGLVGFGVLSLGEGKEGRMGTGWGDEFTSTVLGLWEGHSITCASTFLLSSLLRFLLAAFQG